MTLSPQDLIFQELSSFAAHHELNLGVKEIKTHANRIFDRLTGELISQAEAATLLGVSLDMVHHYRNDGLLVGIPQNPNATRKHYLYELSGVLELRTHRAELQRRRGNR